MIGNAVTTLDAVDGMPPHGDLRGVGCRRIASAHQPIRPVRNPKMISVRGLVVDDRDGAGRTRAERVLVGGLGKAVGPDHDVLGALVRRFLDLVEGAGVRRVERASKRISQPKYPTLSARPTRAPE